MSTSVADEDWHRPSRRLRRWLRRVWLTWVRHPIEMALIMLCVWVVRRLGIDGCSAFGAWLGRAIGWRFGGRKTRVARRNLRACFPEMPDDTIETTLRAMWDHLGRISMEYVRLEALNADGEAPRIEVVGAEHIAALRDDGRPGLVFSAHLGHWEMVTKAVLAHGLEPLHLVYRPANNQPLNNLIRSLQGDPRVSLIQKGPAGARGLIGCLAKGGHAILLVDQKMNDGLAVPFFGREAMTAPALAQLALRYDCPMLPVRVERLGAWPDWGPRFRVTVEPPLEPKALAAGADRQQAVLRIMTAVNARLEDWIRGTPEQWLWVHKRWPD